MSPNRPRFDFALAHTFPPAALPSCISPIRGPLAVEVAAAVEFADVSDAAQVQTHSCSHSSGIGKLGQVGR